MAQANITLVGNSSEIAPRIYLISLVSDKPGTLELRELSLAIDTPDGAVASQHGRLLLRLVEAKRLPSDFGPSITERLAPAKRRYGKDSVHCLQNTRKNW